MADNDKVILTPDEDDLHGNTDHTDNKDNKENENGSEEVEALKAQLEAQREQTSAILKQNEKLIERVSTKEEQDAVAKNPQYQYPQKPEGFDLNESYQDPTSESFTYRQEVERINQEIDRKELLEQVGQVVDSKINLSGQLNKVETMETKLINDRKLPDEEVEDFRDFLAESKNVSMEEMHDIYRKRKGKEVFTPKTKAKPELPNSGDFNGATPKPEDEEKEFEDNVVGSVKGIVNRY